MNQKDHPAAKIVVTKDGPYLVSVGLPLGEKLIVTNEEGESLGYRDGRSATYRSRSGCSLSGIASSETGPV